MDKYIPGSMNLDDAFDLLACWFGSDGIKDPEILLTDTPETDTTFYVLQEAIDIVKEHMFWVSHK